ncbi:MAG TPA: M4 family metallopeptidase [Pyrinomonadaceae bacterium]|nr:M4 family metallopeptidase [Pyrinomonadaceae bacterium]
MFGSEVSAEGGTPERQNGLRTFAMHSGDQPEAASTFLGLTHDSARGAAPDLSALDAVTAARHYLKGALESPDLPSFSAPEVGGDRGEFKSLGGAEQQPLTGTQTVKFRQHYRKIPVYGSLVTVELDEGNKLVSINSGLGEPSNVDPVAKISPASALDVVKERAGYGAGPLDATPRLYYFYDNRSRRWRLVYVTEDVAKAPSAEELSAPPSPQALTETVAEAAEPDSRLPEFMDYVVDAHTGELVAELPRTYNAVVSDRDGLGAVRQFEVSELPGPPPLRRMFDRSNNVRTHDFGFRNIRNTINFNSLPGSFVDNPPAPWSPAAVSAHCNAAEVAKFLRDVLRRNGLDNLGAPIVSSVNCVASIGTREWRNAAWLGAKKQMVYGQRAVGGTLRSYAVSLDIVAHEVLHGLTDSTARLVYLNESGALNESYSDIFGVIVSNLSRPNIADWDWRLGEDLSQTGVPIRDLSEPTRHNQPDHMRDYRHLPEEDDHGGVHTNSGIHNKAAHNILTARSAGGGFLFNAREVAALFYLTLSQQLAATSGFSDSRRGAEVVARTLFRNDANKDEKVQAVADGFERVGII